MKTTAEMLRALVDYAHSLDEGSGVEPRWQSSMEDMLNRHLGPRRFVFSPKRVAYVREIYEKVFDEPQYANDFSAGRVPLGEKLRTPVPDVLKKPLPMKPPGRK